MYDHVIYDDIMYVDVMYDDVGMQAHTNGFLYFLAKIDSNLFLVTVILYQMR